MHCALAYPHKYANTHAMHMHTRIIMHLRADTHTNAHTQGHTSSHMNRIDSGGYHASKITGNVKSVRLPSNLDSRHITGIKSLKTIS